MDEQEKLENTPADSEAEPVNKETIERLTKTGDEAEGDLIPIKIRDRVKESIKRASATMDENDEVVAEYEQKYRKHALDDSLPFIPSPEKRKVGRFNFSLPAQHRHAARPVPANLSENEKLWAAAAHASALISIAVGLATAGVGVLFTLFIPLGIYFYFREESDYVARHALQAFAAQVVGTIGYAALMIVTGVVATILFVIGVLLTVTIIGAIIGIPLILLTILAAIVLTVGGLVLPFGLLVYSMIAAVESYNGHDYSYPWVGDWVDDQLYDNV